jgi:hypothetical protein
MLRARLKQWGYSNRVLLADWQAVAILHKGRVDAGKHSTEFVIRGQQKTLNDLQKYIISKNMSVHEFMLSAIDVAVRPYRRCYTPEISGTSDLEASFPTASDGSKAPSHDSGISLSWASEKLTLEHDETSFLFLNKQSSLATSCNWNSFCDEDALKEPAIVLPYVSTDCTEQDENTYGGKSSTVSSLPSPSKDPGLLSSPTQEVIGPQSSVGAHCMDWPLQPGTGSRRTTASILDPPTSSKETEVMSDVDGHAARCLCQSCTQVSRSVLDATPESDGEASFIEGWADHQSPSVLEVEKGGIFTSICDILSYQLTQNYIICLLSDQDNAPLEVAEYDPSAGSDTSFNTSHISGNTCVSSQTSAPATIPPLLHKRDRDDDDGDDDGDKDRDKGSKRPKSGSSDAEISNGKLLACPYFKYDLTRYSDLNVLERNYRGCSSCFLRDISRLKQHLYRVHRRPDHYCGRCSEEFVSQDALDVHTRAVTACEIRDPQYSEKMTADQLTCIKRRSPGRCSRESWYSIYKILFPDALLPITPFAECSSQDAIATFMAYAERQGPPILSALMTADLQNLPFYRQHECRILEEAIERAFPQLVRELGRHFSHSSSQSGFSSLHSALPSVAGEAELTTALAPNTVAAFPAGRTSTNIEPTRLQRGLELNLIPPANSTSYHNISTSQEVPTLELASVPNDSTDTWPSFIGYGTDPFDVGDLSDYWNMPSLPMQ